MGQVQALHHGAQLPARSIAAILGRPLFTISDVASRTSSISGPPVDDSRSFLSLMPARRSGTHCLTVATSTSSRDPQTASVAH